MEITDVPALLLSLISLLFSIALGIYTWTRRQHNGALPLAIILFSETFCILGFIFEMLAGSLNTRLFWDLFQWLFSPIVALALFELSQSFNNPIPHQKKVRRFLFTAAFVIILLVLTNPVHNLIISNPELLDTPTGSILFYEYSPTDYGIMLFVYGTIMISFIRFVLLPIWSEKIYRLQLISLLTGFGIITAGSFFSILNIPLFWGQRDVSPVTFGLSNFVLALGLFRFHLFDVGPVARKLVVDTIDEPMVVLDVFGQIVDFNHAARSYFGFSTANPNDITCGDLPLKWRQLFDRFSKTESFKGEVSIQLGDSQRVLDLTISAILDQHHLLQGRLFFMRDITEQKQAEELVRDGEESYTRLFNTVKEAIYVLSADGSFLDVNEGAIKMYGYSREELIGKTPAFVSAVGKNDMMEISNLLSRVFETGIAEEFDFWGKRKNGEEFPKECIANKGRYFGQDVIIVTARDVNDRKWIEKKLHQHAEDISLINTLNNALNRGENLESVIKTLSDETRRMFACDDVGLSLVSENEEYLVMQYTSLSSTILKQLESVIGRQIPPIHIPIKKTEIFKEVLSTGCSLLIKDHQTIQTLIYEYSLTASLGQNTRTVIQALIPQIARVIKFKSIILVPLLSDGKAIGILGIAGHNYFTEDDRKRAENFCPQITIAIQRKQVEARLRENEERFRRLLTSAPDVVLGVNQDGLIIFANEEATNLTGYSPEELMNKNVDLLLPKRLRDMHALRRSEYAAQPRVRHMGDLLDPVVMRSDGREVPVDIKLGYSDSNSGLIVIVYMRDITARKQAEVAIQESEKRFRLLFDTAMDGIVLTKPDGTIHSANPAALTLLGYTTAEIKGLDRNKLLDTSDPQWKHAIEERDRVGFARTELLITRKDGSKFPAELNSVLFQQEGILASTFFRDITERKSAEIERGRLIAELKNKNVELERFSYTVSHDLKAPLFTIQGFVGYLERDILANNPERIQSDLDRITSAIDKMQRLLNELLELSRIGRTINVPQETSFDVIVNDAVNLVAGRILNKQVTVNIAPELPMVYCDRTRITQVLQNLIENSVKFMGEQPNPQIWIGQHAENGEIIFHVQDNGVGILPEHQERIFGLFNKLESKAEGTGIGLALVKRIIEIHGGKIWVESEGIGKGATFYFTLPRGISSEG